MNIDENIEKLEKRIERNASKIKDNEDKIHKNSYGLELLRTINGDSLRWYSALKMMLIALIIIIFMWGATIAYLVYVLNDTETVETTETVTQENDGGSNNYIGNDGDINNG